MKYLKYIIVTIFFGILPIASSAEKICDSDKFSIVFINGMLNTKEESEYSRYVLDNLLRYGGLNEEYNYEVRKAFNPSHLAGVGDSLKVLIQKTFDQNGDIMKLDYDAKEMLSSMHNEVKEGRILFVPHSQGNFYANIMSNWIVSNENGLSSSSLTMYNVASPAKYSFKNAKYILSKNDKIISGLVGSVGDIAKPNVNFKYDEKDPNGHNFVEIYLSQGGDKMVKEIKEQLGQLKSSPNHAEDIACIPSPEMGLFHSIEKQALSILDPISRVVVDSALFVKDKIKIAFSQNKEKVQNAVRENVENKIEDINKIEKNQKLAIAQKSDAINEELSKEELDNFQNKIEEIKDLISKQSIEEKPEEKTKSKYYGGGGSSSFSQSIIPSPSSTAIEVVATSTSGSISQDVSTTTSTSTQDVKDIPREEEYNLSTSTVDDLYTREKLNESNTIKPTQDIVKFTEFYIPVGFDDEDYADWVEITNFSEDKYVDMRDAYIDDNGVKIPFPVNAIPPNKVIVLRDDGKMIHQYSKDNDLYKEFKILKKQRTNWQTNIYLYLSKDDSSPQKLNNNSYTCMRSPFNRKRSCEYNEEGTYKYWDFSVSLDNKEDDIIDSSIGKKNNLPKYYCYKSKINNKREKDDVLYVFGNCDVTYAVMKNDIDISKIKFVKTFKDFYLVTVKSKLIIGDKIYYADGDSMHRFSYKVWNNTIYFPDDIGPVYPPKTESNNSSSTESSSTPKIPNIGFDENGCFNGNFVDASTYYNRLFPCGNGWVRRNGANHGHYDEILIRTPEGGRLKITSFGKNSDGKWFVSADNIIEGGVNLNLTDVIYDDFREPFGGGTVWAGNVAILGNPLKRTGTIKLVYANSIFEPERVIDEVKYNLDDPTYCAQDVCKIPYRKFGSCDPEEGYFNYIN